MHPYFRVVAICYGLMLKRPYHIPYCHDIVGYIEKQSL